jgi:hypothetical protein
VAALDTLMRQYAFLSMERVDGKSNPFSPFPDLPRKKTGGRGIDFFLLSFQLESICRTLEVL